jgi:hypothetical protein
MSMMQLLLGTAAAAPSGIVTSDLVMHLDAGDAASYPGSGTAWTDLSGNGNTVTAINSPTWNSGGWFATGATGYFNRATGNNLPQGNDPYTLQAWIRKSTWATTGGIMLIGGFGVTNRSNGLRTLPVQTGHFRHYWWANDVDALNNNASIALNQWFMISASYDGTTRKIIVNTIEVASDTPSPVLNVTSANINVAADLPGSSEFLQGDIAIARIYNRALSAAEIQQNFDAEKARFGL